MHDIYEALKERVKNPYFGYVLITFFALNWKEILFIFLSEKSIEHRIIYFENGTDNFSLILGPLAISAALLLVHPWIKLLYYRVAQFPVTRRSILIQEDEHKAITRKTMLEEARNEQISSRRDAMTDEFASRERVLIDEAKRNDELLKIRDEKIRDDVTNKVSKLRSKNVSISKVDENEGIDTVEQLKGMAQTYGNLGELARQEKNYSKAKEYQEMALQIRAELLARKQGSTNKKQKPNAP